MRCVVRLDCSKKAAKDSIEVAYRRLMAAQSGPRETVCLRFGGQSAHQQRFAGQSRFMSRRPKIDPHDMAGVEGFAYSR
jgi:hypothetical protein